LRDAKNPENGRSGATAARVIGATRRSRGGPIRDTRWPMHWNTPRWNRITAPVWLEGPFACLRSSRYSSHRLSPGAAPTVSQDTYERRGRTRGSGRSPAGTLFLGVLELRQRSDRVLGRAGEQELAVLLAQLGHWNRDVVLPETDDRSRGRPGSAWRSRRWGPWRYENATTAMRFIFRSFRAGT